MGSRSSRGTEIRAFVDFCVVAPVEATDFDDVTGVEAESVRLRAAGSICIVVEGALAARSQRKTPTPSSKREEEAYDILEVIARNASPSAMERSMADVEADVRCLLGTWNQMYGGLTSLRHIPAPVRFALTYK